MIENVMFIVQGTIEATGLIGFSLAIARRPINWARTLLVAAVLAILSYTIQSLSFFFGFHTILIMFLIMLYLTKVGQITIVKGFLMISISAVVLGTLEFLSNSVFFNSSNINPQDVVSNQFLWALMGIPQAVIILLLAILISRIFKPIQ